MHYHFLSVWIYSTYSVATAIFGTATGLTVPLPSSIESSDPKASCISVVQWPECGGAIHLASCTDAIKVMIARAPIAKHPWFFWTGAKSDEPTCALAVALA